MLRNIFLVKFFLLFAAVFAVSDLHAGQGDIKLKGSLGQRYDDNITYVNRDRKSDFITLLSAGVSLDYEDQRTLADLSLNVTQQLFWRYTKNHNTTEDGALHLQHELTHSDAVIVSDTFSHADEPQSFEEEFARGGGRIGYFRNKFDVAYARRFSEPLNARIGYGHDVDLANRSNVIDSHANRFSVGGDYSFSSQSRILGMYEFLNRKLEPGGRANIHTISGGLRQYFTSQLSLEGRAGVDIIDSYNGEMFVKPLWTMTLSDQMNERTMVNLLSFTQRYSTNPYNSDVFNSWRLSGGINTELYKKLQGSVSAFYGQGKYISLNIKENLFGGHVALTYDINPNWKGNLSYTYSETTSYTEEREYRKNVFSLGVSAEF
jgi:hypothetical protein